jgi:hypothetical protein
VEALRPGQRSEIEAHGFAPADYVEWLASNGWGSVGDDNFMLYSGLVRVGELHEAAPYGYWAFGDNLSGFIACFSESGDGLVYGWDSATCEMTSTTWRFPQYIARYSSASPA